MSTVPTWLILILLGVVLLLVGAFTEIGNWLIFLGLLVLVCSLVLVLLDRRKS